MAKEEGMIVAAQRENSHSEKLLKEKGQGHAIQRGLLGRKEIEGR